MRRRKKLKELKNKLKIINDKIKIEEPKKFDKNGKVNMDSVINIQTLNTELYYTQKKIDFINKGKCYLGDSFHNINIIKD